MAVVKYTVVVGPNGSVMAGTMVVTWSGLSSGDTGTPIMAAGYSDKTATIDGTIATSTAKMEGSNEKTLWQTVKDFLGVLASYTALPQSAVLADNHTWLRPSLAGGAGATVTFIVTCTSHKA